MCQKELYKLEFEIQILWAKAKQTGAVFWFSPEGGPMPSLKFQIAY
jgi:hypothetical protein